jgi:hypothetical protein
MHLNQKSVQNFVLATEFNENLVSFLIFYQHCASSRLPIDASKSILPRTLFFQTESRQTSVFSTEFCLTRPDYLCVLNKILSTCKNTIFTVLYNYEYIQQ